MEFHSGRIISLLTQLLLMYYSHAVVDIVILLSFYYFIAAFCLNLVFYKSVYKTVKQNVFYMTLITVN